MFFVVGRIGFEPMKAQGQQIYSLPRLTTSVPAHVAMIYISNRKPFWSPRVESNYRLRFTKPLFCH